ncbi:MAG: ECF-type sigma factor [Planctomycetota bacterium]|jgi:RNA polymerase sigma factor (TIGR02999 family)
MTDVARILDAIEHGEQQAAEDLLPVVYKELRRLAAARIAREPDDQTLQATDLVHEAYLRLVGNGKAAFAGRAHFFGAAAESMRRILVERARRRARQKHGGGRKRVGLDDGDVAGEPKPGQLLALDEALDRLAGADRVKADLVKLRYFAGLTLDQAADLMGISRATACRYWNYARAWLYHEINGSDLAPGNSPD